MITNPSWTSKRRNGALRFCKPKFTTTPLPFVAKGTIAVPQHLNETVDRAVCLQVTVFTEKHFLNIAQRVVAKNGWSISEVSLDDGEKKTWANLQSDPQNVFG